MSETSTPISNEQDQRYCIECGYNLHALLSDRCPECGLPVNTADGSSIPWEGRNDLGRWHAFWRSVTEGIVHTKRLSRMIARPVDAKSAVSFRIILAVLTTLPLTILFCAIVSESGGIGSLSVWQEAPNSWSAVVGNYPYPRGWEPTLLWSAGATIWPVIPMGIFIIALIGAAMPRWIFRTSNLPAQARRRAAFISTYIFAPMILIVVPTAACWGTFKTWDMSGSFYHILGMLCVALTTSGIILIAAVLLRNASIMIAAATHRTGIINLLTCAVLTMWWLMTALVGFVIFPMLVGLIWIMIDSLRP